MKKTISPQTVLLLMIFLLYIAGHLLGIYTIQQLFLDYQMNALEPRAQEIAKEYVDDGEVRQLGNMMGVLIYDIDGRESYRHVPNEVDVDYSSLSRKYMSKIMASKIVAGIEKVSTLRFKLGVIGVPLVKNDEVIGALFLVFSASEFEATLKGFELVFTVTLFIGFLLFSVFFRQYVKQSKELEQTRQDYVTNISHELKSPIASIKALTETLCDGLVCDDETKNQYYGIILNETNRLEHLVLDILHLSKLQSHKMNFVKEAVQANLIFDPVCQKYAAICDDMGITFNVSDTIAALPVLYTNAERITQLLVIFLDNAVKFVGEDGEICLEATVSNKYVTVFVRDNGVGIAKDILPHIFDRFYKEDKAHNTNGSGLGLAIAQEIAAGLNEKINVESKLNKGSVFSFTIQRK